MLLEKSIVMKKKHNQDTYFPVDMLMKKKETIPSLCCWLNAIFRTFLRLLTLMEGCQRCFADRPETWSTVKQEPTEVYLWLRFTRDVTGPRRAPISSRALSTLLRLHPVLPNCITLVPYWHLVPFEVAVAALWANYAWHDGDLVAPF